MGGVWVQLLGGHGSALVSFLFYVNVPGNLECARGLDRPLSLWRYRFPGFSTASGGLSPCLNGFLTGNTEAELKPATFSSPLLFLSFLFSWPHSDIGPLSAACFINDNNNRFNSYLSTVAQLCFYVTSKDIKIIYLYLISTSPISYSAFLRVFFFIFQVLW